MKLPLHLKTYTVEQRNFELFVPDTELVQISYQKGEIAFPYWAQVWPAALGLSNFLVKNPAYLSGKTVLELAAGLGLPSLVASMGGAAAVVASDYVAEAVATMQQTFQYHQLTNIQTQLLDWTALPATLTTEVLLLSDVSYDEQLFATQEKVIRSFLKNKTTVILSTPQRLVAKAAIAPLLPLQVRSEEIWIELNGQMVAVSIFVLQQ